MPLWDNWTFIFSIVQYPAKGMYPIIHKLHHATLLGEL